MVNVTAALKSSFTSCPNAFLALNLVLHRENTSSLFSSTATGRVRLVLIEASTRSLRHCSVVCCASCTSIPSQSIGEGIDGLSFATTHRPPYDSLVVLSAIASCLNYACYDSAQLSPCIYVAESLFLGVERLRYVLLAFWILYWDPLGLWLSICAMMYKDSVNIGQPSSRGRVEEAERFSYMGWWSKVLCMKTLAYG